MVTFRVTPHPAAVLRHGSPAQEAFPHSYGPLNPSAVVRILPFLPEAEGGFPLPAGL